MQQWVNDMVLGLGLGLFEQKVKDMPPSENRLLKRVEKCFVRQVSKTSAPATSTRTSATPLSLTAMPPPPLLTTEQTAAVSTDNHGDADVQDLHVLDVVRKSMIKDLKAGATHRGTFDSQPCLDVIWPATQLKEAGIKFQKSKSPSLKDINFQSGRLGLHATLSLPQMMVDDATESKFLNLMAFEHLHVGSGKEVSSYVCFMDNIIDSDEDVILLSQNKIIKNFVGTDQAVADLFNGISHDVSIDPGSTLNEVHRQVTRYCNEPRNRHFAILKHTYFNTPWSVIAFVAATVALVITIIQFVYTFLSYYKDKA